MQNTSDIARISALIGDPARANMLLALMQGGARTVSELATEAGVGLATTSSHLAQLVDGGLLVARKSGRHKYLELASPEVAGLVEALMALSGTVRPQRNRPGPKDAALRQARVCYDHLAGAKGVQMFQSLCGHGHLTQNPRGLGPSGSGEDFLRGFGLQNHDLRPGRPPLCRECLDWSERQSHLAGRMGRALLHEMFAKGWVSRVAGSRALAFSASGTAAFDAAFPPILIPASLDAARNSA